MPDSAFDPEQRTHLVHAMGGVEAFVPPPLPPHLAFDEQVVHLLSNADFQLRGNPR